MFLKDNKNECLDGDFDLSFGTSKEEKPSVRKGRRVRRFVQFLNLNYI